MQTQDMVVAYDNIRQKATRNNFFDVIQTGVELQQ
jgi:hypothetical protein